MKKKVIIIAICVLVFGLCVTAGYIAINGTINKKGNKPSDNEGKNQGVFSNEEYLDENGQEKYENVVPSSRIGLDVLKHFQISNIYSDKFYDLLDNEGLSDRVKRVWAFIDIMQGKNYVYMLEYSPDGAHTLISESNMKTAVSEIFNDSQNLTNGDLIYNFKYDEESKYYTIPSIGFSNEDYKIIIEVPAQIREYKDRYEVYMYRFYLKQHMEEAVDIYSETKMITSVFYSIDMTEKACDIDDVAIYGDLNSQIDILESYINDGKIDKNIAKKVKYTLVKDGQSYKISKYDK